MLFSFLATSLEVSKTTSPQKLFVYTWVGGSYGKMFVMNTPKKSILFFFSDVRVVFNQSPAREEPG